MVKALVDTQRGVFADNLVVYGNDLRRISNHDGPEVLEETFQFARNQWFNADTGGPASGNELGLPTPEAEGKYGLDPQRDPQSAAGFVTHWGHWLVNPHGTAGALEVPTWRELHRATPGPGARFEPLSDQPLAGPWIFEALAGAQVDIAPQSQVILVLSQFTGAGRGDFDGDRDVDARDLGDPALGFYARLGADLSGTDFLAWQARFGAGDLTLGTAVPEPTGGLWLLAFQFRRSERQLQSSERLRQRWGRRWIR